MYQVNFSIAKTILGLKNNKQFKLREKDSYIISIDTQFSKQPRNLNGFIRTLSYDDSWCDVGMDTYVS